MIEETGKISIRRQCELLAVSRNLVYYKPKGESDENRQIMETMDFLYHEDPTAGSRRMSAYLTDLLGYEPSRNRVRRLMRKMGIEAIYPRKRTTIPGGKSGIRPYLLKGLKIERPNQVWCADITYIPMRKGFMYLFAVMDWYSRRILSWRISNSLDTGFCLEALHAAIESEGVCPEIFNTDQGCQFTSEEWIEALDGYDIRISMDGKGRWVDNVMIERFWRSLKYEDIYIKCYEDAIELQAGLDWYIRLYNTVRPHQGLGNKTPEKVYRNAA